VNELADTFMKIMDQQPLSLALVAMNLILLIFLFRLLNNNSKARVEMSTMIVEWQKQTQAIMADCVSKESLDLILKALDRERERKSLPP
jgi:hypothetical protein